MRKEKDRLIKTVSSVWLSISVDKSWRTLHQSKRAVGARLKACAFSAAARAAILFVSDDTKSSARGGAFLQHVWHVAHFAQQ